MEITITNAAGEVVFEGEDVASIECIDVAGVRLEFAPADGSIAEPKPVRERPDQGLPGGRPHPDNELPGTPTPKK